MLNFNSLPDNALSIKPGIHTLTIVKAERIIASTGAEMLQCSYRVGDSKVQINYDNYVIRDKDGNNVPFGLAKLKKLLKAINVIPQGEFTIKTLIPLILNKQFKAEVVPSKRDSRYLELGSMDTFAPVEVNSPHDFMPTEPVENTDTEPTESKPIFSNSPDIVEDPDF